MKIRLLKRLLNILYSLNSRYIAVHNPLDYNQAMNDANAIRGRLLKYLLPVVIASIAFNIPKFLESRVSYDITETVRSCHL